MLDTSSNDADQIVAYAEEVISGVVTGLVSQAVRDTERDGVKVVKDDYIGFVDDRIYVDDPDRTQAALGLAEALKASRYDIMLVICGSDVPKEEADAIRKTLRRQYRRTEVVMIDGGQPVYDYIIILE